MNPVLQKKWDELERADKYACWYLVKHPVAFDKLCYLVSFLEEYKEQDGERNLETYVSRRIGELNAGKPELEISDNYRTLRVAAFFGLIRMDGARYESAEVTETFEEIRDRCGGEFEKTDLYGDIIERQIEKVFISSPIDEEYDTVRKDYRLYPVMLLYKVLLELGRCIGEYRISMSEYRYLAATAKVYEDYLDTLLWIMLFREDETAAGEFEQFKSKFDNRLIQALKLLPALCVDRDSITLRDEYVDEVAEKIYLYERDPRVYHDEAYIDFLCSVRPLTETGRLGAGQGKAAERDGQERHGAGEEGAERYGQERYGAGEGGAERDGQERHGAGEEGAEGQETDRDAGIDESLRVSTGENILLYGVPGAGKSWAIEHEYCDDDACMERLVFHPDYMHSDFVGQILPVVENGSNKVRYRFVPGPFTNIVRKAYKNPTQSFFLVIEEINRGNAPAIFGEIFQLLDRLTEDGGGFKKCTSAYGITHPDIAREVYGNSDRKVRIPANLSIIGTMNTSDQNVFTLDTAFQRRWILRMIPNSFAGHPYADEKILDTDVSWRQFCEAVNGEILRRDNISSAEDKRMGAYFVTRDDLCLETAPPGADTFAQKRVERHNARFAEKVLKYLWDDAFRFSHGDAFDTGKYRSLEAVVAGFMKGKGNGRFQVFGESLRQTIINGVEGSDNAVLDGENGNETEDVGSAPAASGSGTEGGGSAPVVSAYGTKGGKSAIVANWIGTESSDSAIAASGSVTESVGNAVLENETGIDEGNGAQS